MAFDGGDAAHDQMYATIGESPRRTRQSRSPPLSKQQTSGDRDSKFVAINELNEKMEQSDASDSVDHQDD